MPRIQQLELHAVDLPFRKPFKHSAAERTTSESLILRLQLEDGTVGFGESLPRQYVTGESRDAAYSQLEQHILPQLINQPLESIGDVLEFLAECDGRAPAEWTADETPGTAAWCAVDLALLDAYARAAGVPAWQGQPESAPRTRYSVVVSSEASWKTLLLIRLSGIRDVKLKVEAGGCEEAVRRCRRILGSRCRLRVDANMAWSVEQAMKELRKLDQLGAVSCEQPIAADDVEGLARLVRESRNVEIMVDESLHDRDSLARLIKLEACTAVNVRISKCGGVVAAARRCDEAATAGLKLQVGCQVGESSLLSAAQLALIRTLPDVDYLEGCFGKLLLREDPFQPNLQFGFGGRLPRRPPGNGFGVTVDESILNRWSVRHTRIG